MAVSALTLDAEYNLRGHPDRDRLYADYQCRSDVLRSTADADLDIAYADHPLARLDVFHSMSPRAVIVFFHGGYWRALDRQLFSFLAQPFLNRGLSVVMPDYPLAPQAQLASIVEHARLAMAWTAEHVARVNQKTLPQKILPIIVSGHSAGGHLAALCANDLNLAACVACIPISGLFDLQPLRHTNVNDQLQFTDADISDRSPLRNTCSRLTATLIIAGGDETTGFIGQSEAYAKHLHERGAHTQLVIAEGLNHFTILDACADPQQPLGAQLLAFADSAIDNHLND